MSNTGAVHSVRVSVRETVLDQPVYEHELSVAEIESGLFELPTLSTGDYFEQNMAYFRENSSWPKFELTLEARYENEAGDGEDTLTITREPYFELGVGVSSMGPDDTWNEYIPADCFYVQPWEDFDDIRFVIDDPDAVTDPMTFSVDMSWNGRHAEAGEYEEILKKDEYTIIDADGGQTPYVGYTKILVLRRPDWMPEEGTLHVTIVQVLASTGEQWVREYDLEYPIRYDWDF